MSDERKDRPTRERRQGHGWLRAGIVTGFVCWVVLYGIGNIIPSEIYRACFDPTVSIEAKRVPKYREIVGRGLLPAVGVACLRVAQTTEDTASGADRVAISDRKSAEPVALAMNTGTAAPIASDAAPAGSASGVSSRQDTGRSTLREKIWILVWGAAAYPFVNVPVLAALAALVGGCTSKLFWESNGLKKQSAMGGVPPQQASVPAEAGNAKPVTSPVRRRSHYLTESPFVSMARGFAVALAYTAGVGLLATVGGANPTPQDYTRYASFVSFLGFLVGYDADIFHVLLEKVGGRTPTVDG